MMLVGLWFDDRPQASNIHVTYVENLVKPKPVPTHKPSPIDVDENEGIPLENGWWTPVMVGEWDGLLPH